VATCEHSSRCPSRGWFALRDPCERREHRGGVGELGGSPVGMHVDHDRLLVQSFGGRCVGNLTPIRGGCSGSSGQQDGLLTAVQEFARAARIATPQLDAITALVIEKARRMGLYPLHG